MYPNTMRGVLSDKKKTPKKDGMKLADGMNKATQLWNWILPPCGDAVNTWYKFSIKKLCCNDTTFFPFRSLGCADLRTDMDGILLKNSSPDSIYYAQQWKEGEVSTLPTYPVTYFQTTYLSHLPIQCTVKVGEKDCTIVSVNAEGLCDTQPRAPTTVYTKTSGRNVETVKMTQSDSPSKENPIKTEVFSFIRERLRNQVELICIQELFLQDKSTHKDGKALLEEFCGRYLDEYEVYYDGFICGMIVLKTWLEENQPKPTPPKPLEGPLKSILKKDGTRKGKNVRIAGRTRKRGGAPIPLSPGQDQKQTVIKLSQDGYSLYVVNVCLSPLYHLKKQYLHENEMRFVMDYLSKLNAFSNGVLFIGDHKHNGIELYNSIRQESSRRT